MKNTGKIILFAAALFLSGCASTGNQGTSENDPLEGFNRAMFSFNDTVDEAVLKPVATTYQDVTPSFVQTGVGNFFGNIGDVWTMVNNFLQGKVENGLNDFMRVAVNTTFRFWRRAGHCIGSRHPETQGRFRSDAGDLGCWIGVHTSCCRCSAHRRFAIQLRLPVDIYGDLWTYTTPVDVRNTGAVIPSGRSARASVERNQSAGRCRAGSLHLRARRLSATSRKSYS
jgi:phospholipid-binding lipoprotein MlaA